MTVAALILAAGRGTRFGEAPKLLALLDGKPLVRHVAEAALASRARPVLVVTGHRADAVERALAGLALAPVPNPHFAEGLSTSLKAGFAVLPAEVEAAIVLLGDMPLVSAELIDDLAAAWAAGARPPALIPVHEGRRGNPVVLSRALAPQIAGLTGDAGAGPLLRGRTDVVEWPVGDPSILTDIDTPDALAALRP
ncbi:MAG TPA: nucleotidyltransferase family protein [Microvirga sp.]